MRAFIALDLSPEAKGATAKVQSQVRQTMAADDWLWVAPENFHITLRFLGEISEADVDTVRSTLSRLLEGRGAVEYRLSGAGGFSGRFVGSTLVLRAEPLPAFEALRRAADAAASAIGVHEDEHPFRPHVTIARRRGKHSSFAVESEAPRGSFDSTSVGLYHSELGSGMPKYHTLERWNLR